VKSSGVEGDQRVRGRLQIGREMKKKKIKKKIKKEYLKKIESELFEYV
jgi:hypothetical protein